MNKKEIIIELRLIDIIIDLNQLMKDIKDINWDTFKSGTPVSIIYNKILYAYVNKDCTYVLIVN